MVETLPKLKIFTALALLLLLGFLLQWAVELDSKPQQMDGETQDQLSPVSPILSGQDMLLGIKLESVDLKMTFAVRSNGWWWMFHPEMTMADQGAISPWVTALTRPKIQRILSPSEWKPQGETLRLKVGFKGRNSESTLAFVRLGAQPNFYYLELSNGSVLKCEAMPLPAWPKDHKLWRTKRLFPMDLRSIASMHCRWSGHERQWLREKDQWTSTGSLSPWWKTFFKEWQNMLCQSFIENFEASTPALAEWEIRFVEGNVATAKLYQDALGQWILAYEGRSIAQVLDQEVALACFPIAEKSQISAQKGLDVGPLNR